MEYRYISFFFLRIFYMNNDKYKSCIYSIKKFLQPVYLKENHASVSFVCVCLVGNICISIRDWHPCGESSSSLREKYFIM